MATASAGRAAKGMSQAPARFARPCAATASRLVGWAGQGRRRTRGSAPSSCASLLASHTKPDGRPARMRNFKGKRDRRNDSPLSPAEGGRSYSC
jgi:hypothetical protein